MTDKGSETLEQRAQAWREGLAGKTLYNEKIDEEVAEFARTVAREMIAEIRNEADERAASHGELKTTTVCYLMNEASVETLREVANKFESSPRYGVGSSKVKPGEPTQ